MPRPSPLCPALRTYANQRRTSFVVESEVRKLCAFHDAKQRSSAPITISRQDWDLLKEGRSHMSFTGFCGGHPLVINGTRSA